MSEQLKSTIRHILTALGVVLGLIGLDKFTGVIDYLLNNLDSIWSAVLTVIGVITTLLGFFKNKERFAERTPEADG